MFNFFKKLSGSSNEKSFSENSYKALMPFFVSSNSYLQTFLSVFASSLMALDSVVLAIILSGREAKSSILFGFGASCFIASIALYLVSFLVLFTLRRKLIAFSKLKDIKVEEIAYRIEDSISSYLSLMMFVSISFFMCFLVLLKSIVG